MTVPVQRGERSVGSAAHLVDEYLEFAAEEYLRPYIGRGGTAVKLVAVGDRETAGRFAAGLAGLCGPDGVSGAPGSPADGRRFGFAVVDAVDTRVHMMDQLFFAIARQIDWMRLAGRVLREAYQQAGFPAAGQDDADLTVAAVAAYHGIDTMELYRTIRRTLESSVLADATLAHQFRIAMLRLCQAHTGHTDVSPADEATVLGWLRGEKVLVSQLKAVLLHTRIARHNARPLLTSLTRWLRRAGSAGLVLHLDLARIAVVRRPAVEERDGFYYSRAAALDAYELLRQLIDATDELEGLFVTVSLPPGLVTDESRGLPAYSALQLRVADEVRDRNRANPYASLVRLDERSEAVR